MKLPVSHKKPCRMYHWWSWILLSPSTWSTGRIA